NVLMKLGLLPYGEFKDTLEDTPALTTNLIGRHVSKMAYTKLVSNKSPWFIKADLGAVYSLPVSTIEGRFISSKENFEKLVVNGQIASQYVDLDGKASMKEEFNPTSSMYAVESITSPDGRILGKTSYSDRIGKGIAINIYGNQDQGIFKSGVEYFK
ncbi:MAG TPA: phosphoribosylformylglycinamidine synthase, partial [Clostridiales bacterium]|nr:phosphoribosylformylglycinamidine synthase [Clostridiales bacterium]